MSALASSASSTQLVETDAPAAAADADAPAATAPAAPAAGDAAAAPAAAPRLVLRLNPRPHITFTEDTVDNEHLGRKKSKRCCIYTKKRPFGESSTESSGSDCDDEDCVKKPIARKKGSGDAADGGQEETKEPAPPPAPAGPPGAGWARPRRKDKVPDYQRFHA
jgi:protein phosphatase 1 regulatory subunit 11